MRSPGPRPGAALRFFAGTFTGGGTCQPTLKVFNKQAGIEADHFHPRRNVHTEAMSAIVGRDRRSGLPKQSARDGVEQRRWRPPLTRPVPHRNRWRSAGGAPRPLRDVGSAAHFEQSRVDRAAGCSRSRRHAPALVETLCVRPLAIKYAGHDAQHAAGLRRQAQTGGVTSGASQASRCAGEKTSPGPSGPLRHTGFPWSPQRRHSATLPRVCCAQVGEPPVSTTNQLQADRASNRRVAARMPSPPRALSCRPSVHMPCPSAGNSNQFAFSPKCDLRGVLRISCSLNSETRW